MDLLKRLLSPYQYCEDATAYLLSCLNVKFTRSHLQRMLLEHPDYPSMMSIADVIGAEYNVACAPLRVKWDWVLGEPEIKPPFIAHVRSREKGPVLVTIERYSAEEVVLYNPVSTRVETYATPAFREIYLETVLPVGLEADAGEKEYDLHRKEETRRARMQMVLAAGLPLITVVMCLFAAMSGPVAVVAAPVVFTLLALAGCIVCALMLWYEMDQYNPALKQICQAGAKVNCAAVLHSKASRIFGLTWSSIGFAYFTGMLVLLLATGITAPPVVQMLGWISLLALPYTVFSVYYQWKVTRQWCMLCLVVQGVILLQFATALAGGLLVWPAAGQVSAMTLLSFAASFGVAFTAIQLLVPALERARESRQKTISLQRLKHNPQIFEALLARQKSVEKPPAHLGITFGNANGAFRLIKVCNPYCPPCAKAHPAMEELAGNNDEVGVQVIFTATEDEKDMKMPPVAHLLAIDARGDEALTKKALHDWYSPAVKDYPAFAAKYPVNGELQLQKSSIKQMSDWCNAAQITHTPTFFVCVDALQENAGFYQLPEMYTVADLKYFFAV